MNMDSQLGNSMQKASYSRVFSKTQPETKGGVQVGQRLGRILLPERIIDNFLWEILEWKWLFEVPWDEGRVTNLCTSTQPRPLQ